jgi:DNA-binding CsgD family transcriptional regulator
VAAWSEANPLATPPVWRHKNDWGEFTFRVFRMEQNVGLPTPRLLGVSVERREPLRQKMLRRIGELPLSTRETELCLALLDGDSRGAIAERLGISETTAITHTRNLYGKLDVHNRTELIEKLHAM